MRGIFRIGGYVACAILIIGGIGAIVAGLIGHHEVAHQVQREKITGTPDMTPSGIQAEARKAGLTDIDVPDCSVANKPIDSGARAYCFASYMRIHALLDTGGFTYSQMGQYQEKPGTPKSQLAPGGGTSNEKFAVIDPKTKEPAPNTARNIWVTETALSTALDTSFFATAVADFAIVMGGALILIGIGLLLFLLGVIAPRRETVGPS
jgi:hypothetical protein